MDRRRIRNRLVGGDRVRRADAGTADSRHVLIAGVDEAVFLEPGFD